MTTIIVEDGSIVANANSYVTVADADTYFNLRNNTTWSNLDPTDQKAPFLILAVDYMQQMYRQRWLGWRDNVNQKLDFPRLWVQQFDAPGNYGPAPYYFAPNFIPDEVKQAQMMLAVRIASGDLAPDITREDTALSVKVGTLAVDYDKNSPAFTTYRAIDRLLAPFLNSSSTMARIVRS